MMSDSGWTWRHEPFLVLCDHSTYSLLPHHHQVPPPPDPTDLRLGHHSPPAGWPLAGPESAAAPVKNARLQFTPKTDITFTQVSLQMYMHYLILN